MRDAIHLGLTAAIRFGPSPSNLGPAANLVRGRYSGGPCHCGVNVRDGSLMRRIMNNLAVEFLTIEIAKRKNLFEIDG